MSIERRKPENAALRELVSALRDVINTRDALWALSSFDRLFRFDKCRTVLNEYDEANARVYNAIQAVKPSDDDVPFGEPPERESAEGASAPLVSTEEFEMLLGKQGLKFRYPSKKKPH